MKTHRSSNTSRAFTLLELLVVVSIIAILCTLATSAYQQVIDKAHRLEAAAANSAIASAVNNYHAETNRFPAIGNGSDVTSDLDSGNDVLKVLLGENVHGLNPVQRAFLDNVHTARNGINGLAGREGSYSLVDPWGTPYRVVIDTNGDNKVANPDADNSDSSIAKQASKNLLFSVIVQSAGRDKKFNTQDDVVSWR